MRPYRNFVSVSGLFLLAYCHPGPSGRVSILFVVVYYSVMYVYACCFHVLAVVNNAAVNMGVVSLWYTDFIKCEFAGSYDGSVYNLGGYHHTGFCSSCTNVHPYQWYTKIPFSLHHQKHWLSCVFLIIAIFTGVMWHHILVLIWIFLMISDVPHLSYIYWPFICLLVKNVYSGPLSIFKIRLFSCCWVVWVPFVFWILTPYYMVVVLFSL